MKVPVDEEGGTGPRNKLGRRCMRNDWAQRVDSLPHMEEAMQRMMSWTVGQSGKDVAGHRMVRDQRMGDW